MGKAIDVEAHENWQKRYQVAVAELMALFDKGIPLCALDNDFESDQGFQYYSDKWKSEIDSYMKKFDDCLASIRLRELMEEHLKELPATTSVYWIHCINYEFEAWVVGDILAAQECVRCRVQFDLDLELFGCEKAEEDALVINNSYGMEKIEVGKNSTYSAKHNMHSPISEEMWERIKYNPHIPFNA